MEKLAEDLKWLVAELIDRDEAYRSIAAESVNPVDVEVARARSIAYINAAHELMDILEEHGAW